MRYSKYIINLVIGFLLLVCGKALAYFVPTTNTSGAGGVGGVTGNLIGAEMNVHKFLQVVCIVAGIGLILGAVVKYKKYRKNPIATPFSSIITNLVIGGVLILLAFIPFVV